MRDPNESKIGVQPEKIVAPTKDADENLDENPEKAEERKLMQKFGPGLAKRGGHSAFLNKRIQPNRKFFDSGDYNVEKQKGKKPLPPHLANLASKGAVAPPDAPPALNVHIEEKTSPQSPPPPDPVITTSLVADNQKEERDGDRSPTNIEGLEIPRPNTVPARKNSIFNPSAASKLSPQPLLHQMSQTVEQMTGDDVE